jgi:RNA polymerase sigma-70 factor (ECF subfamily)
VTGKGFAEAATLPAALAADLDGTFERVVLAYQGRIYGFALRLTGNPQDAEEVAQDAFVRAYRALQRFQTDRIAALALRPWLYQIALNVVRNRVRGKRHRTVPLLVGDEAERENRDGVPEPPDNTAEGPAEFAERAGLGAMLARLVGQLPDRYRAAVILRHVEGLSYPETAAVLGQPVGTVKANVHRGTKLLRASWLARLHEEDKDERERIAVAG